METLHLLNAKLENAKDELRVITHTPMNITKHLNVGRILRIKDGKTDWGYGCLVNFHKRDRAVKKKEESELDGSLFIADIIIHTKRDPNSDKYLPGKLTEEGEMLVLPFSLSCIHEITVTKISTMPTDLTL